MENKFSYGLKTLFIATIILLPYPSYGYVGQGDGGDTRALYHFCKKSGTTAGDSSGYTPPNNGTFLAVGEPAWNSNGRFGYALQFDGTDDYVSVPDATSLDITDAITIEAWVKPAGDGWKYKRPITLSPATSQANYQIKVELTTSNFDYSKAKTNGEDLRFYETNGTSLDYWIEVWNATGTSTIWVEVATSGEETIYMYYGNPSASSASNGTNTFEFFDDFTSDITGWTIFDSYDKGGTLSHIAAGYLRHVDNSSGFSGGMSSTYGSATSYSDLAILARWRNINSWGTWGGGTYAPGGGIIARGAAGSGAGNYYRLRLMGNIVGIDLVMGAMAFATVASYSTTHTLNAFYTYQIALSGTTLKILDASGTELASGTNIFLSSGYAGTNNNAYPFFGGGDVDIDVDYFAVRKYVSPEPTTSVGNETAAGISKAGAYGIGANTTTAFGSINNQTISASIPSGWAKRKPITITGSASDLSYHQVKVDVDYDSDMQTNFDDLRFTDADGKFLSYWIESYTASISATVWVKIPSIPTSGTTIYMYYGNPSASSASNGTATFIYFNDFETEVGFDAGLLNPTRNSTQKKNGAWSIYGEGSSAYEQETRNDILSGRDKIFEAWIRSETSPSLAGIGIAHPHGGTDRNGYQAVIDERGGGSMCIRKNYSYSPILVSSSTPSVSLNTWYFLRFTWISDNTLSFTLFDESLAELETISTVDGSYTDGEYGVCAYRNAYWDDYRVRKYASTEPSATVLSEEDTPSGWTHIALTYDKDAGANQQKLYINGVLSAQATLTEAVSTNTNDLLIGDIIGFNGTIDEVRILDSARTAFNAGVVINEVCYWPSSGYEWIELYNGGGVDINCAGWRFLDADGNIYEVPSEKSNYTISPGNYVTIWLTEDAAIDNASNWYTINDPTHTLGDDDLGGDANTGGDRIYVYPNATTGHQNLIDFIGWGTGGGNDTEAEAAGIWDMDAGNPYIADDGEEYKVGGDQMYAGATIGLKSDGNYEEGKRDWTAYQYPGTRGSSNSGATALAVELISFDAVPDAWAVKLIWLTEVEINNSHWIIERAEDEVNYKQIKKIGSRGPVGQTYVYIDKNVNPGITYHYKLGDVEVNGNTTWHGPVKVTPYGKTYKLTLNQPYPNPNIGLVIIGYSIPGHTSNKKVSVNLSVYDIAGRVCEVIVNEEKYPGSYKISWNPVNLSSGIYFLKLNGSEAKKIFLLK